jgi:hypothetical protein
LNHVNWDLDDINDSISIVKKNRSKYTIDDAEVSPCQLLLCLLPLLSLAVVTAPCYRPVIRSSGASSSCARPARP